MNPPAASPSDYSQYCSNHCVTAIWPAADGHVMDEITTRSSPLAGRRKNLPEPKVPEAVRASGQRMGSAARYFFWPMYIPRWLILKA